MNWKAASLLALGLCACKSPKVEQVIAELQSPGYNRHLEAGKHVIQVRYLPPVLQALSRGDLDGSRALTEALLDSLKHAEGSRPGISFVLTLSPADTSAARGLSNDVVYGNLSGYADYRETMQAYQFGLKEKIWIEAGGRKYPLAQYTLENSWGMTRSRNFFLTFHVPEGFQTGESLEFSLVLDDIVPGLSRRKITWTLPIGEYDALI